MTEQNRNCTQPSPVALSLVTRDDTLSTAVRLASTASFFPPSSLLGAAVVESDAWSHDSAVNFEIGAQIQWCNYSCVSILDRVDSLGRSHCLHCVIS